MTITHWHTGHGLKRPQKSGLGVLPGISLFMNGGPVFRLGHVGWIPAGNLF